jgi:hypothetical protein
MIELELPAAEQPHGSDLAQMESKIQPHDDESTAAGAALLTGAATA